jgi:hypothetical protein
MFQSYVLLKVNSKNPKDSKKIPAHEHSSGKVFSDLSLENPEEELLKMGV